MAATCSLEVVVIANRSPVVVGGDPGGGDGVEMLVEGCGTDPVEVEIGPQRERVTVT